MKIWKHAFIILTSLSMLSCSLIEVPTGEEEGQTTTIDVTGVSLNAHTLSLYEDQTYQLSATIKPSDATNKTVTYKSSNSNIATVSNSGLVTAYNEGTSTITVTTKDGGFTDTCTVTVSKATIPVTSVKLNTNDLVMYINEVYTFVATVKPNNASNKEVTYKSSNTSVATITNSGEITGLKAGTTTVTVTTKDGGFTDTCNVQVKATDVAVTGVSLDKTTLTLDEGDVGQLTATVSPSNASNKSVSWSSSDNNTATVSSTGVVTAIKEGTATITVTTRDGNFQASCSVTVNKKEEVPPEVKEIRMQDTPILHCWNWSMNNIASKLDDIKAAGFKTIQLSPMQPQKDYYFDGKNENYANGWWKLYQPLGFTVATEKNSIGTKQELTSLCAKAKAKGIDVIMDVVSNHLAGGGAKSLNTNVRQYEQNIYDKQLIHKNNACQDWEDPVQLLTYPLGDYPDLQTENTEVQSRVISLLKEYIDCGVNGFRFDAAKHIETPDDGELKSDYWPNVLGAATEYAKSKNLDEPYYYGETLNTIGRNRKYTSYTKYMSITDTRQGSSILGAVTSDSLTSITDKYVSGIDPDQLVLWAESHDTYMDGSTTSISVEDIHKTYLIQTSRKDASTLYFARPNSTSKLGDVGREDYKNVDIKAINDFHNTFVGQSEDISLNNGCFINVRGKLGAAIVGISNSSNNVTINVGNLEDGNYKDLITDKDYVVTSSSVSITLTNNACVLVNKDKSVSTTPEINIGSYDEIYEGTQNINVTTKNATKVTYSINNGTAANLTNNVITLDNSIPNGDITIKITASNDNGSVNKTINLIKSSVLVNKNLIIKDIDTTATYFVWAWSNNNDSKWYPLEADGNYVGADVGNSTQFILVKFTKGTTTPDWSNKLLQTDDLTLNKRIWNYSEFTLKQK